MVAVVHADIEAWAGSWIRARAARLVAGTGLTLAWVSNTDRPAGPGGPVKVGEVHVRIRDDSGPRQQLTKDALLGVTVTGYARADLARVKLVAERLVAVIQAEAPTDLSSPVADVPTVNGPYTVSPLNDDARLYASVGLTLVGQAL